MELQYNVIYRKKNKGIQAIISYKDGSKWKQKSKQGFEDSRQGKRKAKEWALDTIKVLENNITTSTVNKNITFKEFYDMYINHIKLTYQNNTIINYNSAIKHFKSLYDKNIRDITTLDIEICVDKLVIKNRSSNTIHTYVKCINALFNYAVKNDFIIKNPVKDKIKIDKPKKTALTNAELNDLLCKMKNKNYKYYIVCLIAGKAGLRRGEILGLTWSDITSKYIDVNKQWKVKSDGSYDFGKVKSKNSVRKVPISGNIYNELMEYKRSLKSIPFNNRVLDFDTFAPISISVRKYFKDFGYDISIHELRHTYATLLIQNGLDFKTVAAIIGDDVDQVLKTYSHVNDDMMNRAEMIINNIF